MSGVAGSGSGGSRGQHASSFCGIPEGLAQYRQSPKFQTPVEWNSNYGCMKPADSPNSAGCVPGDEYVPANLQTGSRWWETYACAGEEQCCPKELKQ